MGLQVRLRHALGERVLELPDRDVGHPLVVGRGAGADLQVPSVSVAPQHAVLFLHDGQWVVQGHAGIVTLNGEPLEIAASLQTGDVVGLGAEPRAPTLEVDPIGAAEGRRGPVRAARNLGEGGAVGAGIPAAAPVEATIGRSSAPVPKLVPAPAPAPAPLRTPAAALVATATLNPASTADLGAEGEPGDGDTIAWDPQTPVPQTTQFYVPKGRQTPVGLIVGVVVVGVAALVGVGVLAYQRAQRPRVVVIQQPAPAAPAPAVKPRGLIDPDADQALARQSHGQGASPSSDGATPNSGAPATATSDSESKTPPASAPVVASAPPSPAAEPRALDSSSSSSSSATDESPPDPDDPEWKEIASAHFNVRHQGVAILKFDEFRRDRPGKYVGLLDQYTDDAVNWLYWQRVAQLWARQEDLTAQVNQKKQDLKNQPAGAFHEQLAKDKADLEAKAATTAKLLSDEMGYVSDVPPDLEKPSELQRLSAQRDPAKYAAFKKHVLKYVRDYHGSVWWEGE